MTRSEPISTDSVPLLNNPGSIRTRTLARLLRSVVPGSVISLEEVQEEEEDPVPTFSNPSLVRSVEEVLPVLDNKLQSETTSRSTCRSLSSMLRKELRGRSRSVQSSIVTRVKEMG